MLQGKFRVRDKIFGESLLRIQELCHCVSGILGISSKNCNSGTFPHPLSSK